MEYNNELKRDNLILSYKRKIYINEKNKINTIKRNDLNKNPEEKIEGNYIFEQLLDKSDISKVVLAKHIITGEKVAIKILNKKLIKNDILTLKRIKKEIQILKMVKHENIINLLEKIDDKNKIYLITEYYPKDLLNHILKSKNKRLPEEKAIDYFFQIINGLHYLHQNNICHRNIRPENILLDEKNSKIKLIDFGLSTPYSKNELLNSPVGSIVYAPPEMHLSQKYSGELADIWNAGIVLYFMVCGYLPFSEEDEEKNINHIITGYYEIPSGVSRFCAEIIKSCLQVNPYKRIDFEKFGEFIIFTKGLKVGVNIIPIDEKVILECKKYLGNTNNEEIIEEIKESVKNNKCNELNVLYYLVLKKMIKKGYESISDLSSDKFKNYINNKETKNESVIIYKQKKISNFILKKNNFNNNNRSYNNIHKNKSLNIPSFKNQIIYSPMIIKSYNSKRYSSIGRNDLMVRNNINPTNGNDSNISCKNIKGSKIKLDYIDNIDNNYKINYIKSISPKINFKRGHKICFSTKNCIKKDLLYSYTSWKNKNIKKDILNRYNTTESNIFNRNSAHVINSTILTSMKNFQKNKKERNNSKENKTLFCKSNNFGIINNTIYYKNKNYFNKNEEDENNDLINILTEDKPLENFSINFNFINNNINRNSNTDRRKNIKESNIHKYNDYNHNYNKSLGHKLKVRKSTIIRGNSTILKKGLKIKKFLINNNVQTIIQNENNNNDPNLSYKNCFKIIYNNNLIKNVNNTKKKNLNNKLINNSYNKNVVHKKNNSALLNNILEHKNKNINIKESHKEIENGNCNIRPNIYKNKKTLYNFETKTYDIGVFDLNCIKIEYIDKVKMKINKVLKNKKINYNYVKNNKYRCSKLGNFFDIEISSLDDFLLKSKNIEKISFIPLTKRNGLSKKSLIYYSFHIKKNDMKKNVNGILKEICI